MLAAGCGGDSPTRPDPDPGAATFLVRACADSTSGARGELYRVRIVDSQVIAQAQDLVGAGPLKIVSGRLVAGDGGFNRGWSWHLAPETVRINDASIELCDGCPSFIEADLDYWLGTVGDYCPWSSEILARES